MGKLLKGAIVVAILYFAVTQGLPWLKSQLGELGPTGNSNQAICHAAAQRAADDFAASLRQFSSPPIDIEAWDDTVSASRHQIETADKNCRNCDHEACLETIGAVGGLERLLSSFDESVRAGRGIPLNGASQLDAVYDSLNRARSLL